MKCSHLVRHRKNRYRTTTPELPPVLYSEHGDSVTTLLGENVELRCTVLGYKAGQHTVSWTRRTEDIETPTALTFGSMVSRYQYQSQRCWCIKKCKFLVLTSISRIQFAFHRIWYWNWCWHFSLQCERIIIMFPEIVKWMIINFKPNFCFWIF